MDAHRTPDRTTLADALAAHDTSTRLRAAMAVGSTADPDFVDALVGRCAVEPDFYVRDMLTWALTRLPHRDVLARLSPELSSARPQARSQALHTLSKIGAPETWEWVTAGLLTDDDDEVARSAWRAAVVVVPSSARASLARSLAGQFGRGDRDLQLSLSRALISLGDVIVPAMEAAAEHADPAVATHARATMALMDDPELGFDAAVHEARRVAALGTDPA
ncbi:HEAT repeat domain-containing protein [Dietzia sp. NPDC055340]